MHRAAALATRARNSRPTFTATVIIAAIIASRLADTSGELWRLHARPQSARDSDTVSKREPFDPCHPYEA